MDKLTEIKQQIRALVNQASALNSNEPWVRKVDAALGNYTSEEMELIEECDECHAEIPVVDGGSADNKHHEQHCSLYNPENE